MRAVMLVYDIRDDSEMPNPSRVLYRCGVRANLSCWIIPEGCVPQELLAQFDANSVKYRIVPFDETAEAEIRRIATEELTRTGQELQTSLLRSIFAAKAQYDSAMQEAEVLGEAEAKLPGVTKHYDRRVKASLRKAGKMLNAAVEACEKFDLNAELVGLFDGLQNAIAAQHKAFLAEVEARRGASLFAHI